MPRIVASGTRHDAFDDFSTAHQRGGNGYFPILLVDSESPVSLPPWDHLRQSEGWQRPASVSDDQAQLMVQCMETWIVCDRKVLEEFFGPAFNSAKLPTGDHLEERGKSEIFDSLIAASKACGKTYSKGRISFEIVGQLDPAVLRAELRFFERLLTTLEKYL